MGCTLRMVVKIPMHTPLVREPYSTTITYLIMNKQRMSYGNHYCHDNDAVTFEPFH